MKCLFFPCLALMLSAPAQAQKWYQYGFCADVQAQAVEYHDEVLEQFDIIGLRLRYMQDQLEDDELILYEAIDKLNAIAEQLGADE